MGKEKIVSNKLINTKINKTVIKIKNILYPCKPTIKTNANEADTILHMDWISIRHSPNLEPEEFFP